ncbi:MAG TPA: RNA polymerase sigma factor [Kofleriaceae bacterium]|nr:RNA polymerase sigma factor [Kofleriaceae bacterium]
MPKLMARRPRPNTQAARSPVADDMAARPTRDIGELRELAALHEPFLRGAALRITGDRELAKDLVQETLARALVNFHRFQQGTNARAWMVTILTRLYYDHLKHQDVVNKASAQLVTLEVTECDMGLMPAESEEKLHGAIEALEPDLRAVVVCCYLQGLSYKQAAATLNVPIGTISTRLMRARERLKTLLTEES